MAARREARRGPLEDEFVEIRTSQVPDSIPTDDPAVAELAWLATPVGLAQVSGYLEALVRDALDQVECEIHVLHSVWHGVAVRYYKGPEL